MNELKGNDTWLDQQDDYCLSIVASIQDHIAKINRNTFTNYTSETEI